MSDRIKFSRQDIVFVIVAVFMLGFIAGIHLAPQKTPEYKYPQLDGEAVASMGLPAVDSDGNGVMGTLFTTIKPGNGKILVDTSRVLNYLDTQLSGRIAAKVAGDYAKTNLSNIDIIYTIKVNASIIEGPSAGASMAVSVLLALENKTSNGIVITGTINSDGTIGTVGSVLEKGSAAKAAGATLFLVPADQSTTEKTNRARSCERRGNMEVCRIGYKTETINIGEYLNLTVKEVRDIGEAYSYFTGKNI